MWRGWGLANAAGPTNKLSEISLCHKKDVRSIERKFLRISQIGTLSILPYNARYKFANYHHRSLFGHSLADRSSCNVRHICQLELIDGKIACEHDTFTKQWSVAVSLSGNIDARTAIRTARTWCTEFRPVGQIVSALLHGPHEEAARHPSILKRIVVTQRDIEFACEILQAMATSISQMWPNGLCYGTAVDPVAFNCA